MQTLCRASIFTLLCFAPGAEISAGRLIFTGVTVIDGTGGPAYQADVAIEEGVIALVGSVTARGEDSVIPSAGKVLAPGFIDLHNHSARGILEEPAAATQVSQGITTILLGPDGGSPYPVGAYLKSLEEKKTALNVALMAGHGTLRRAVMGEDFKRPATEEEIRAMVALLHLALLQGAFGLSSGLEYDPGFYSETSELVALAREAARAGGFYMTHIRDEEEGFAEALKEAAEIGQRAGIPVQISHLKLGNRRVWARTAEALEILRQARRQGIDISADCYPYNAWSSGMSVLIPSRRFDDAQEVAEAFDKVGGPGNILITRYQHDPGFEFKTLETIAGERNVTPVKLFMEILEKGGANIVCHSMSERDVEAFYQDPLVMVASDGGLDSRHPRKAGTFPRVLGRLVREKGLLTMEQAIHKMTGMPARRLGLKDRGLLRPGYRADLVLFDPHVVIDRAEFQYPDRLSEGILLTLVNGTPVWRDGKPTGNFPGTILRRQAQ